MCAVAAVVTRSGTVNLLKMLRSAAGRMQPRVTRTKAAVVHKKISGLDLIRPVFVIFANYPYFRLQQDPKLSQNRLLDSFD